MELKRILTVGHSTLDFSNFVQLLSKNGVTAVADVRSVPASRFTPQFNRISIERELHQKSIKYVFLGKELGARAEDVECYENGQVQYERLARAVGFIAGIERLIQGANAEKIAVMCREGDPLEFHRTVLVAQVLTESGIMVEHIRSDGRLELHALAMERLMSSFGLDQDDLFRTSSERLEEALKRKERQIAYVNEELRFDGKEEI